MGMPGKIRRDERHDDMLELLLPDNADKSGDPFLQWRRQTDEDHRFAFGETFLLAVAFEYEDL
jgi:hypothetical protein